MKNNLSIISFLALGRQAGVIYSDITTLNTHKETEDASYKQRVVFVDKNSNLKLN